MTKPLTSGILFSTSPIFILRTAVVANWLTSGIWFLASSIFILRTAVIFKPIMLGILFSTSLFFLKFCFSVFYWFVWIKVQVSGIFFTKLFTFVFSVLYIFFLSSFYPPHHLNFLNLWEQFPTNQDLIYLLLFLKSFKPVRT